MQPIKNYLKRETAKETWKNDLEETLYHAKMAVVPLVLAGSIACTAGCSKGTEVIQYDQEDTAQQFVDEFLETHLFHRLISYKGSSQNPRKCRIKDHEKFAKFIEAGFSCQEVKKVYLHERSQFNTTYKKGKKIRADEDGGFWGEGGSAVRNCDPGVYKFHEECDFGGCGNSDDSDYEKPSCHNIATLEDEAEDKIDYSHCLSNRTKKGLNGKALPKKDFHLPRKEKILITVEIPEDKFDSNLAPGYNYHKSGVIRITKKGTLKESVTVKPEDKDYSIRKKTGSKVIYEFKKDLATDNLELSIFDLGTGTLIRTHSNTVYDSTISTPEERAAMENTFESLLSSYVKMSKEVKAMSRSDLKEEENEKERMELETERRDQEAEDKKQDRKKRTLKQVLDTF
jgi:hypothetical protein